MNNYDYFVMMHILFSSLRILNVQFFFERATQRVRIKIKKEINMTLMRRKKNVDGQLDSAPITKGSAALLLFV